LIRSTGEQRRVLAPVHTASGLAVIAAGQNRDEIVVDITDKE
jgi:hypothetical protein